MPPRIDFSALQVVSQSENGNLYWIKTTTTSFTNIAKIWYCYSQRLQSFDELIIIICVIKTRRYWLDINQKHDTITFFDDFISLFSLHFTLFSRLLLPSRKIFWYYTSLILWWCNNHRLKEASRRRTFLLRNRHFYHCFAPVTIQQDWGAACSLEGRSATSHGKTSYWYWATGQELDSQR